MEGNKNQQLNYWENSFRNKQTLSIIYIKYKKINKFIAVIQLTINLLYEEIHNMKISIICPIYNGEQYIELLNYNLLKQELEDNQEIEILYALTRSSDKSEHILKKLN